MSTVLLLEQDLKTKQISLKRGTNTPAVYVSAHKQIKLALAELDIPINKKVIVLIGGAGGIGVFDKFAMRKAVRIIAKLAEKTKAIVIDGGTQAGIMSEIGKQRKRNHFSFPLIGVVFDKLLKQEEPKKILDANHTHFILIPGDAWGDESSWIAKIATVVTGKEKSITVLINGGKISAQDVNHSKKENRAVFVMRGTGRLADSITLTYKLTPVYISEPSKMIQAQLQEKM